MRVIVDEIPSDSRDCVFSTGDSRYCKLCNDYKCNNTDVCPYLDPITNYDACVPMPQIGHNIYQNIPIERK